MPSLQEARPPYVSFETRAIERQFPASHPEKPGMLYVVEVDFVKVTPQGSKDIFEKEVADWFENLRMKVQSGYETPTILRHYEEQYDHWKKHQELPVKGTPIKAWPLASKAQQQLCISLNLHTVEDVANANAEAIRHLGMGGQILRNRAEDFLKAQNDTGPLVARVEAMDATLKTMTANVAKLTEENRILREAKGINQEAPRVFVGSAPNPNAPDPLQSADSLVDNIPELQE